MKWSIFPTTWQSTWSRRHDDILLGHCANFMALTLALGGWVTPLAQLTTHMETNITYQCRNPNSCKSPWTEELCPFYDFLWIIQSLELNALVILLAMINCFKSDLYGWAIICRRPLIKRQTHENEANVKHEIRAHHF